jgi:hypothetical protein
MDPDPVFRWRAASSKMAVDLVQLRFLHCFFRFFRVQIVESWDETNLMDQYRPKNLYKFFVAHYVFACFIMMAKVKN